MPVFTYTNDIRDQDGKETSAEDLKENLLDIEKEANSINWENLQDYSLDQTHLSLGDGIKSSDGTHGQCPGVGDSSPWGYASGGQWKVMASSKRHVRTGDGVFIAANITFDAVAEGALAGDLDWYGTPVNLHLRTQALTSTGSTGSAVGSYSAYSLAHPERNGSAGITWAYQVPPGLPEDVGWHLIELLLRVDGENPVGSGFWNYGKDYPDGNRYPARSNLNIFVIHR